MSHSGSLRLLSGASDALTPHEERASISRAVVAREELQLSSSHVQTFSWRLQFCVFGFSTIFVTTAPQSRGVALCGDIFQADVNKMLQLTRQLWLRPI